MQGEVDPIDQRKCKATIKPDGSLWSYDSAFAIHTSGQTIRYVLLAESGSLALYVSQWGGEDDELTAGGLLGKYPTLQSHAQIDGDVVGAGDMVVDRGKITSISNQSGTWRPRGANLAGTLKFIVRIGLLSEDDIVSGQVTVQQFISKATSYDVDAGDLVTLIGRVMEGKLIKG